VLPRQAKGGEFANFIDRPRKPVVYRNKTQGKTYLSKKNQWNNHNKVNLVQTNLFNSPICFSLAKSSSGNKILVEINKIIKQASLLFVTSYLKNSSSSIFYHVNWFGFLPYDLQ